ncbi:hypothetical protein V8E53_011415 [Lactarius tabidus]
MVNISLNINGPPILFLTIPNDDVLRLSIRPYKWIRYVLFSICGARGDLSTVPNGQPVDYDSTSLADDINLYYNPSERCLFVDHQGLSDKVTSSDRTPRSNTFRDDIIARDGVCIVTQTAPIDCDAAHLIPRSKGHAYIDKVIRDRSGLYESPPSISDINAVENGVLLEAVLHRRFGTGRVALLKTPNYGLEPADIIRFEQGPARGTHYYITVQQWTKLRGHRDHSVLSTEENLDPDTAYRRGAHVDAQFRGSGLGALLPLPPSIILDYVYGVAAYRMWRSDKRVHDVMSTYHREQYADILPLTLLSPTSKTASQDDGMVQAMDDLNLLLMRVNGINPQDLADKWEKQMEEEERVAQEKSRSKVMEWRSTGSTFSTSDFSSNSAEHVTESRRTGSTFATSGLSSNAAYKHW